MTAGLVSTAVAIALGAAAGGSPDAAAGRALVNVTVGGAKVGLRVSGLRCDDNEVTLPAPAAREPAPGRLELARPGISERWTLGRNDLEHTISVDGSVCAPGAGLLAIEIESTCADPRVVLDARGGLDLCGVRYSDLHVVDARGTVLPARMEARGGAVDIRVDVRGASWPVLVDPTVWAQRQELVGADGKSNDGFGKTVAVSGTTIAVGTPSASRTTAYGGALYIFDKTGTTWTQLQEFLPEDVGATRIGTAVAMQADTLAVGASTGVEIFQRVSGVWKHITTVVHSGSPTCAESLALDQNTLVIGCSTVGTGAAYVMVSNGGVWTEQQVLVPNSWGDGFGAAVAVHSNTVAVGAPTTTFYNGLTNAIYAGQLYIFRHSGTGWTQGKASLGSATGGKLGQSAAVSADYVVFGEPGLGRAQFSVDTGTTFTGPSVITSAPTSGFLGTSTALVGPLMVSGAPTYAVNGVSQGALELLLGSGTTWGSATVLAASDGALGDSFGSSVSADTGIVVGGAPNHTVAANPRQGAAYVFVSGSAVGDACSTGDACAAGHCVSGVCCDTSCDGACEACGSGTCLPVPAGTPGNPDCGALACDGTQRDCTTCTSDDQCVTGKFCNSAGNCVDKLANGAACDAAADCTSPSCTECASGNCADGACCDTACDGACDVCSAALGASSDGKCTALAAGTNPSGCDAPFACNGVAGACPTACTSDADCALDRFCDVAGTCTSRKGIGAPCNTAAGADCTIQGCRECTSGDCVDGVCCDTPCAGSCDVCSLALGASAEGTCSLLPSGTPGRPVCPAGKTCDGQQADCPGGCATDSDCAAGQHCGPDAQCHAKTDADGGTTPDGGHDTGAPQSSGGCGCRIDARPSPFQARIWGLLGLALLELGRRRRRRSRR